MWTLSDGTKTNHRILWQVDLETEKSEIPESLVKEALQTIGGWKGSVTIEPKDQLLIQIYYWLSLIRLGIIEWKKVPIQAHKVLGVYLSSRSAQSFVDKVVQEAERNHARNTNLSTWRSSRRYYS